MEYIGALFFFLGGFSSSKFEASLPHHFHTQWETLIIGNQEQDFYSKPEIKITQNHIFLWFPFEARVLMYSREGSFLRQIGRKGTGPGEFLNPIGVSVDQQQRLWIWDQTSRKLHTFNQSGTYLKSYSLVNQSSAQALILRDRNHRIEMFFIGSTVHKGNTYLGLKFNLKTLFAEPFGKLEREPPIFTWYGAVSPRGTVATADALAGEVRLFSTNGKEKSPLKLASPYLFPSEEPEGSPTSMTALRKRIKRLNEEKRTEISGLFFWNDQLIVKIDRRNFKSEKEPHIILFCENNETPKNKGIPTWSNLMDIRGEKFVFMDYTEEEFGSLRFREAGFHPDRL